ncbi:MAG: hypothetical protein GX037_06355 [Trueperella sp.]|nr:hypothetical protein [Trueperella sp.]
MTTTELIAIAGTASQRRGDRQQIALSEVEIHLDSDEAVAKCLRALDSSDARLAATPQMYDWVTVWKETSEDRPGATVRFGVAWYDRDFYAEKRDVYLGEHHLRMFAGFADSNPQVIVKHYELAA